MRIGCFYLLRFTICQFNTTVVSLVLPDTTSSLCLCTGKLDNLGPFLGFLGDEPSEVGR
jgi:hypothetical protein